MIMRMKIFVLLLLGIAKANAGTHCGAARNSDDGKTFPCIVDIKGAVIDIEDVGEDKCKTLSTQYSAKCCMHNGKCVVKQYSGAPITPLSVEEIKEELLASVIQAADKAKVAEETDADLPDTVPRGSPPRPFFPAKCKPDINESYALQPPAEIPYCFRIPCSEDDNSPLDKSLRLCASQPGCYFDKELHEYRKAFGPSILPGVPVCQLAVRNTFFLEKAAEALKKYGSWNSYFTNCLLKSFDDEIRKGPSKCEFLPLLDYIYVTPKLAGWKNITAFECALINACWRPRYGCFYPIDISKVRVKSRQQNTVFQKNEITYGRPRCQAFDNSSPWNILKSFHQCLSSGCAVDQSVTSLYYNHLFSIGNLLTPENHWKFWNDVTKGHVGAYNIESVIDHYGPMKNVTEMTSPQQVDIIDPPGDCGIKDVGGRPCEPHTTTPKKATNYCPYKPLHIHRFPFHLKGRFDGCCEINLCYIPKSDISNIPSTPSLYYTEWSFYGQCSASCGIGEQRKYRKCITGNQQLCSDKLVESKPCQTKPCFSSAFSSYSGFANIVTVTSIYSLLCAALYY